MAVLDDKKRKRIEQVIRDHHLAFQVEVLGEGAISKEELADLKRRGVLTEKTSGKRTSHTRASVAMPAAHTLGVLAAQTGDESVRKLSDEQFWEYIKQAPPDLTEQERHAIEASRTKVGNLIRSLSDRLRSKMSAAEHEADAKQRKQLLMTVRREVAEGIAKRQSVEHVAAAIKRAVGDLKTDWYRIAHTEVHNAIEEGRAHAILNAVQPGDDPLVFKRPRPDACRYCKALYLDGVRPRVFRMSELVANGNNEGRRARSPILVGANATEWRAVIGSTHPWCQCALHMLPEGFGFGDTGELVYGGEVKKSVFDLDLLKHECV